ncbi:MAG TPA: aminopeptidase [Candidatus Acidoferrum sp.]|jgi:predicted aminopeptidase|nr:aminopeptidase [Candidatus Acidoferrum sp.]
MSLKSRRLKKVLIGAVLVAAVGALSGCHTLQFYGQAIKGQYQLVAHEQSILKLTNDPHTPPRLKQRLDLLERLRAFAAQELKLPVDDHYRKYVDVHRPFVVWNVEAAPQFSLQARTWWYPLVGSLEYRGYFSLRGATNYAGYLRRKGYDVSVGGVSAYSTLGWFKDPALSTFLFDSEAELAETVFHELAHQRLFAHGDTDFNEAFATSVGEEGARRWLKTNGTAAELDQYAAHLRRNDQFVHLVIATRVRLEAVYGDAVSQGVRVKATSKNHDVSAAQLLRQKQAVLEDMKNEYARLKAAWGGDPEYDGWFAHQVNNAGLNSVAAYYDFVPGFDRLLAQNGGDLEKYYAAAKAISKKPKKERHEALRVLAKEAKTGSEAEGVSAPGH